MMRNHPWDNTPREPPPSRTRWIVWGVLVIGGALLLWELSRLFPGASDDGFNETYLVRNVALLALLSAGVLQVRGFKFAETLRNFAIWVGIASVLLLGYTYQEELTGIWQRVRGELAPSYAITNDSHTVVIAESEAGDYRVTGRVNGEPVTFAVDTGASDIVLAPADAQRLGIDVATLTFDKFYETANGAGQGASITVGSLTIGTIELHDVKVSVNRAPMSTSLLGMAFLRQLKSFEFRGRRLTLKSH